MWQEPEWQRRLGILNSEIPYKAPVPDATFRTFDGSEALLKRRDLSGVLHRDSFSSRETPEIVCVTCLGCARSGLQRARDSALLCFNPIHAER